MFKLLKTPLLSHGKKPFSKFPQRTFASANCYPGSLSQFTNKLTFESTTKVFPTYRVMDEQGNIINKEDDPKLGKDMVTKMYQKMITLNVMDTILYDVQRQGRVSFYMTSFGEEAIHFGSAAAIELSDVIFAQYRETGVLMWRGFTLDEYMNQCYSNRLDYGKGRQMPVHYGAKHLNFQTISSPLATQLPQAVGSAYAQKLLGHDACTVCYFGEGAASEGDFHAAINFAATLSTPTIFFCRNNRYAISTPSSEQFVGDGIAARGPAFGVRTVRVDGNDLFAVYNATKEARNIALKEKVPILIEAMTYRLGHHSTSDDSSRYRTTSEIEEWKQNYNPITRVKNYLLKQGWWSEEADQSLHKDLRKQVLDALKRAEAEKKPSINELFTDVYDTLPPHLLEQKKELEEHLAKYPEAYPLNVHAQ